MTGLFCSCSNSSHKSEIYQTNRNNILNVHDRVKEIHIDDVLIGSVARVFSLNNYLIIGDYKSYDKLIHLFDKQNFKYISSVGSMGEGPGEIANMGYIGVNSGKNEFYVSDHGKQKVFSYNVDSLIVDSLYTPKIKAEMNQSQFPSSYTYINDTLSVSIIINPTGTSGFNQSVARWNMSDGKIDLMHYEHPQIEKKRVVVDASMKYNMYVEGYEYHDLMTLCDMDGNLICNIYGKDWDNRQTNKTSFYRQISFYKDKIIALYSGDNTFSTDKMKGMVVKHPTKFLVFSTQGEYLKTLETGYNVTNFCCDEENGRLVMNFDDDIQFGYIDLDEILE